MTVGWVTLDVGEQALVYSLEGSARIEDGPKRLFLWRETLKKLKRHSANQNEFLVIRHKNGRIEHVKGPTIVYENPIAHEKISAKKMIALDANEALVIYRQEEKDNTVKRYIEYGPTYFMPLANEWTHQFCWHGTDPNNKTRMVPNGQKFERLQIIPDQFYYNVDEVRTADDALIRVKLMIFYEIKEIETMLNTTKDPMADFINCVCADVIAFASKYTYMEFIERSAELNNLSCYPQLIERSKKIGYSISKVVFRGYFAHDKLQRLHDEAIGTRTKLKIAYEKEEQEQMLIDVKMKNEKDRIDLEQKMQLEELRHQQEMEKNKFQHRLDMELRAETENNKKWEQEKKSRLEGIKAENEQKIDYYRNLHGLTVDLNEYVRNMSPRPAKIVRVVASKETANLHLHQT